MERIYHKMPLIYHYKNKVVYEWHFVVFPYDVKAHKHRASGIVVFLFIHKLLVVYDINTF